MRSSSSRWGYIGTKQKKSEDYSPTGAGGFDPSHCNEWGTATWSSWPWHPRAIGGMCITGHDLLLSLSYICSDGLNNNLHPPNKTFMTTLIPLPHLLLWLLPLFSVGSHVVHTCLELIMYPTVQVSLKLLTCLWNSETTLGWFLLSVFCAYARCPEVECLLDRPTVSVLLECPR